MNYEYELAIEKARKTFSNKNQFEKEKAFALQYFKKTAFYKLANLKA